MLKQMITTAAVIATVAATAVARPDLEVGNKAPTLDSVKWLQGDTANEWKSGEVYVLDFWATWCGPCVAAIPHVNDLQKEYKNQNVHVIGVAIWPRETMVPTAKYIKSRDDMNYAVAADIDGKTAKAFMQAAGKNGIPTVMVIGKTGTLEWIGHPMDGLDDVLEAVVHDTFDAVAFQDNARAAEEALQRLYPRIMEAQEKQDWPTLVTAIDELIEHNPSKFKGINGLKYIALAMSDAQAADRFGNTLVSKIFADDSNALNGLAWSIVGPDSEISASKQDANLAIKAAKKANKMTKNSDPSILDTLARAYYVKGDAKKAFETQQRAVDNASGEMKADLEEALAIYETAAKSM